MQSRLYKTVGVRLSHRYTAATAACGLDAERAAGRIYRAMARIGAQQLRRLPY